MTVQEVRQQKKAEALNRIRKIYYPKNYENGFGCSTSIYNEESRAEQRDEKVRRIINDLEKDLESLRKYKICLPKP